VAAYKAVFLGTERAKHVLFDILANCGVDSVGFSADPYETAYAAGRRSVAMEILGKLNMDVRDVLLETVTMEDIE
jgi:hypothetical protein